MFKKLRWPLLVLLGALTLAPGVAMAEHRDHVQLQIEIGHYPRHCHYRDRWVIGTGVVAGKYARTYPMRLMPIQS